MLKKIKSATKLKHPNKYGTMCAVKFDIFRDLNTLNFSFKITNESDINEYDLDSVFLNLQNQEFKTYFLMVYSIFFTLGLL